MKQILLGTTALAAVSVISTGALAQTATTDSPVQLKLGGQYYAGLGVFAQQDDQPGEVAYKRSPVSVQEYFLIKFTGSTTFSNGVTAGIWTRLNAFSAPNATANTASGFQSSNNTTIKDSYLFLKDAATWGEFRLGDDSDVRRNIATGVAAAAANGDQNVGANSADIMWLNTPVYNLTTMNLDGRGTKAVYYSPTIAGFQFGASFAPDKAGGHGFGPGNFGDSSGLTDRITSGITPSYLNSQSAYNFWSVSGQWSGEVGPMKVMTTVGYSTGSRKCGVSTGIAVPLGQNAGAAACSTLGASASGGTAAQVAAATAANIGTQNADPHVYNAGITVDYGRWELGADYEQSVAIPGGLLVNGVGAGQAAIVGPGGTVVTTVAKTNEMINKVSDLNISYTVGAVRMGVEWSRGSYEGLTGDTNVKRAAVLNQIQVGGAYTLGPGVALIGMVQEALYDAGGAYVPTTGSYARSSGVAANNNIYAKDSNSTAFIFETSIKF